MLDGQHAGCHARASETSIDTLTSVLRAVSRHYSRHIYCSGSPHERHLAASVCMQSRSGKTGYVMPCGKAVLCMIRSQQQLCRCPGTCALTFTTYGPPGSGSPYSSFVWPS